MMQPIRYCPMALQVAFYTHPSGGLARLQLNENGQPIDKATATVVYAVHQGAVKDISF